MWKQLNLAPPSLRRWNPDISDPLEQIVQKCLALAFVEPIHPLNGMNLIPTMETPVKNLYLVNAAQIFPALTNGESVTRHAREAAEELLKSTTPALA